MPENLFEDDDSKYDKTEAISLIQVRNKKTVLFRNKKLLVILILAALIIPGLVIYSYIPETSEEPEDKVESPAKERIDLKSLKLPVSKEEQARIALLELRKKTNVAPTIKGVPGNNAITDKIYRFTPDVHDNNREDTLIFSIKNQPPWSGFNPDTGTLTGMPEKKDIGNYEGVIISVSDGIETVSLPSFDISVAESEPIKKQIKKISRLQPPENVVKKEQKAVINPPETQISDTLKQMVPPVKEKTMEYNLPDLMHLIRKDDFGMAAMEYKKHVESFPEAYSIVLEIDCLNESVQTAFQQGRYDTNMFIVPRKIVDKECFIVLWGLYKSEIEAKNAIPGIAPFFLRQMPRPRPEMLGSLLVR